MAELVDFLVKYVDEHFATEERLMKSANYEHFEEHSIKHVKFISKVSDLVVEFATGELDRKELKNFLNEWLNEHIMKEDLLYKGHI